MELASIIGTFYRTERRGGGGFLGEGGGEGRVQSVGATADMMEPGASLQHTAKDGFLSSERTGKNTNTGMGTAFLKLKAFILLHR